jgi:hypothetical protein
MRRRGTGCYRHGGALNTPWEASHHGGCRERSLSPRRGGRDSVVLARLPGASAASATSERFPGRCRPGSASAGRAAGTTVASGEEGGNGTHGGRGHLCAPRNTIWPGRAIGEGKGTAKSCRSRRACRTPPDRDKSRHGVLRPERGPSHACVDAGGALLLELRRPGPPADGSNSAGRGGRVRGDRMIDENRRRGSNLGIAIVPVADVEDAIDPLAAGPQGWGKPLGTGSGGKLAPAQWACRSDRQPARQAAAVEAVAAGSGGVVHGTQLGSADSAGVRIVILIDQSSPLPHRSGRC